MCTRVRPCERAFVCGRERARERERERMLASSQKRFFGVKSVSCASKSKRPKHIDWQMDSLSLSLSLSLSPLSLSLSLSLSFSRLIRASSYYLAFKNYYLRHAALFSFLFLSFSLSLSLFRTSFHLRTQLS